jgi:hypothetical protein
VTSRITRVSRELLDDDRTEEVGGDLTLPVAGVFKGARNPLDVSSFRSPTDKLRPHHSWATDELICAGERHLHRLPADYTCI